jgi:hypothetical protein
MAADTSWAWYKNLNGRHSPAEIKKACDSVGGDYSTTAKGGYSCYNEKTDCVVTCSKSGSCSGGCATREVTFRNPRDILRDGTLARSRK